MMTAWLKSGTRHWFDYKIALALLVMKSPIFLTFDNCQWNFNIIIG